MRYLGGKTRIAKEIASVINEYRGPNTLFWDPFCGGLSVACALAEKGPGFVSDTNLPLISLYKSIDSGWRPPTEVSEDDYQKAKDLEDTDPLKAFIGFGCSFGGKWFGGYARGQNQNPPGITARSLEKTRKTLSSCTYGHANFLEEDPFYSDLVVYCDPPYAGTTKYKGTDPFDHVYFWDRVFQWESVGVPVFVSEYSCPVRHEVLWSRDQRIKVGGGTSKETSTEKLFRLK